MTSKELMKILKRFPSKATILFNGAVDYDFAAALDNNGNWELKFAAVEATQPSEKNKNFFEKNSEKISC